jgi:capsular exopolysaccharide synthesis family protein
MNMSMQKRSSELPLSQRLSLDSQTTDSQQQLTLQDIIRVLKRRRKAAVVFAGAVLLLVALYLTFATRRYAGEATLEFDKQNADMLGLQSNAGGVADISDSLDYNIILQTQVNILESDTLALQVIKELNLEQTEDYKPKFDLIGSVIALFQSKEPSEDALPLDQAPRRRVGLLKKFHKNLKVELVTGSRMIQVTFLNPDRYLASAATNKLLNDYMDYSFQTRYLSTSQATSWLSKQLEEIKLQMQSDQARAARLQREAEIFGVGQDKHNATLSHLEALDAALATAQGNRIVKEAAYRAMQNGDPELIAGLANSASMGVTGALMPTNELFTIQTLRAQESQQKAIVADMMEKYGARNPQVIEAKEHLLSVQTSIKQEAARLAERAKSDLDIASQTERMARTVFQEQKALAGSLSDKTIQYELAANEAASSQGLYEELLRKLKEAGVMGGLQATNAHIVDPARVPDSPAKPRILLFMVGGLAFALFGGVCTAVLVEAVDDSVSTMNEVSFITGLPSLGFVPRYKSLKASTREWKLHGGNAIIPADSPRPQLIVERDFMIGECFRSVRTAVLLAGGRQEKSQVIAISSALPSEGKTTTSLNLALVLAQQGSKVLLVDADMRRSTLDQDYQFEEGHNGGLSTALQSGEVAAVIVNSPIHDNLSFLASGPQPQFPSDLLGSPQMAEYLNKWRSEYQYIIIDTPPILLVTDTLILAPEVDGVIIVARHGVTSREALLRTSTLLAAGGANVLGVLLNAMDKTSTNHYGYYGHKNYFDGRKSKEVRAS